MLGNVFMVVIRSFFCVFDLYMGYVVFIFLYFFVWKLFSYNGKECEEMRGGIW